MSDNLTKGISPVNQDEKVHFGTEASDINKANAVDSDFKDSCSADIQKIKDDLLMRDANAHEFTSKPVDLFNRGLRVEDPEVNRELHDAMQDAEDMLQEMQAAKKNNNADSFSLLGAVFSKFSKSTDKEKINDKIRKSNDIVKRVEESTNLGKDLFLDLNASRVNLQDQSEKLSSMLQQKGLTVDDLFIPDTLSKPENAQLVTQMRKVNSARDSFAESCITASDFTLAKSENANVTSHVQTCNVDTLHRLEAEMELCHNLVKPQLGDGDNLEPNPLFDTIVKAPKTSISKEGVIGVEESEGFSVDEALMESVKAAMDAIKSMNPFSFKSARNASQSPSQSSAPKM